MLDIKIRKEVLRNALHNIISIIDKSSVKPILSNFLLRTIGSKEDQMVEFSATDYELSIIEKFPAEVRETGSICISARKVHDICKEFLGEDIHIKSTEQLWIHLTSGKSELRLPSVEVGLYPQTILEELPEKVVLNPETLKKCIDSTLYAAQTNESRRNLMGVCLSLDEHKGTTRWLATDGHRLAQVIIPVKEINNVEAKEVIIPRKALAEVRKAIELFDEDIEISFDDRTLQFTGANISFKTRLIEGKFPNCDPIIPKDNELIVTMNKEYFINSLRIVSSISSEKLKPVKFTLREGLLTLESEKAEYGEVSDELVVDYKGVDFQIGFNARYLLDALAVINGERIQIELKNPMSPCIIKDPEDAHSLAVVMPLRIEW
ncbi:DNA polymerase III subunit beta [Deltaproteobacteria bacterium TL4]